MIRKKLKKAPDSSTLSPAVAASSTGNAAASNDGAGVESSELLEMKLGLGLRVSTSCRVVRFVVSVGGKVSVGSLIASCENLKNGEILELRSQVDGEVRRILHAENDQFDGSTDPLVILSYCVHNVIISGLCAICGRQVDESATSSAAASANVSSSKRDTATVNVEGGIRLEVTRDEALQVRESTVTRLFQARRLSLVLDLDHTLVHCTDDPRAMTIAQNAPPSAHLHTFELDHKTLVLKLRPGLMTFLQQMRDQYFEMYVYTAGTRAYAQKVCSIIDPDGSGFAGRIVSRDDTPELGMDKDLTRLFPVDDTMVIIVDDRDVWGGVANLLTCEPFDYFRGMHDVNNSGWKTMSGEDGSSALKDGGGDDAASTGMPLKQTPYKEEEMDPGLARVDAILKQAHGKFYYGSNPVTLQQQLKGKGSDVKVILRDIRLSVLRKVTIAFDPEIKPKNPENADRYLETLFARAKACGATLMDKVDERTTHLVSCGDTELARYGKHLGIWVVRPEWLEKSEHYWQRVKEEPYSVFRTYGTRPKSAPPMASSLSPSTGSEGVADSTSIPPRPNSAGALVVSSTTPAASEDGIVANEGEETEVVIEGEEEDLEDFANELQMSVVQQGEESS